MTFSHLAATLLVPLLIAPDPGPAADAPDPPQRHTVLITAAGYRPGTLTVRTGDIVRFVQNDIWAHNIEFHDVPHGTAMAASYDENPSSLEVFRPADRTAQQGPFLIGPGRVYEVRIGDEMPAGTYEFGCTTHAGWRGQLVVDNTTPRP